MVFGMLIAYMLAGTRGAESAEGACLERRTAQTRTMKNNLLVGDGTEGMKADKKDSDIMALYGCDENPLAYMVEPKGSVRITDKDHKTKKRIWKTYCNPEHGRLSFLVQVLTPLLFLKYALLIVNFALAGIVVVTISMLVVFGIWWEADFSSIIPKMISRPASIPMAALAIASVAILPFTWNFEKSARNRVISCSVLGAILFVIIAVFSL